jgi:hypothetical protein
MSPFCTDLDMRIGLISAHRRVLIHMGTDFLTAGAGKKESPNQGILSRDPVRNVGMSSS